MYWHIFYNNIYYVLARSNLFKTLLKNDIKCLKTLPFLRFALPNNNKLDNVAEKSYSYSRTYLVFLKQYTSKNLKQINWVKKYKKMTNLLKK